MANIQRKIYIIPVVVIIAIILFIVLPVVAGDFQSPPKDYQFGNNFDSHQETKLKRDKSGNPESLTGSLYIIFTGEVASGLSVARHPGPSEDCNIPETGCIVGWSVTAVPGYAKFLYHGGVNGDDHAIWMWNRVDFPQPGSYTHFHWISEGAGDEVGADPRAAGGDASCDADGASALIPDDECYGWFIEIRAVRAFAFEHGNEIIPVMTGLDNATHMNLVSNYPEGAGITNTR
jgi:hypothetical protein